MSLAGGARERGTVFFQVQAEQVLAYCTEHGSFVVDQSELYGPCPRCLTGKAPKLWPEPEPNVWVRGLGVEGIEDTAGYRLGEMRNRLILAERESVIAGIEAALKWCDS